jgi:phenylacetate-coenzyme A ligase PaaK-like adenylate-forming protein
VQLEKIQGIWRDCLEDVPYYRNLVAQGRAPQEICSWEDFKQIPILDRITLKENVKAFRRISGPPDTFVSTAGSTGQPLQLGQWRWESDPIRIAKLVTWIRLGYELDSNLFLIWGHAHLLGTGWLRYYNHVVRKFKDWLVGYHRVDAYTLDRPKAEQIVQDILRKKPTGLIGYAAILDLLCRYSENYHAELRNAGVKFVMSCAEPPPRPDTFDLLHKVFGCPILQEFGGVDFGHVGFKVDNAPYTLFPDLNILEAEPDSENDEACAAVVTTLYQRYVPLIRYRQGDLLTGVVRNQAGIVIAFDEQVGRINDMITLSDGTSIHSVALVHCFKEEESIFNVQLILSDNEPCFSLITKNALNSIIETRIRERLSKIHPTFRTAHFEYVTDLATNRAGKRRWIVDKRTQKN